MASQQNGDGLLPPAGGSASHAPIASEKRTPPGPRVAAEQPTVCVCVCVCGKALWIHGLVVLGWGPVFPMVLFHRAVVPSCRPSLLAREGEGAGAG